MIKRWIKTAPALLLAVLLCVRTGAGDRRRARSSKPSATRMSNICFRSRFPTARSPCTGPPSRSTASSAPEALDGVPAETTSLAQRQAGAVRSDGNRARLLTAGDAGRTRPRGISSGIFSHLNTADEDAYGIDGTVYDTYFFIEDGDSPRLLEITGRALFAAEYGDGASNPHAYASSDASSAAFPVAAAGVCRTVWRPRAVFR